MLLLHLLMSQCLLQDKLLLLLRVPMHIVVNLGIHHGMSLHLFIDVVIDRSRETAAHDDDCCDTKQLIK
jgi:hypothetical protein